jgi:hypothetical protein
MSDQKYFVRVYPNGMNKPCVKLQFSSEEEKEKYIKAEYWFCKEEENEYLTAGKTHTRQLAKHLLYAKRTTFAKKSGFSGNGKIWTRKIQNSNNAA